MKVMFLVFLFRWFLQAVHVIRTIVSPTSGQHHGDVYLLAITICNMAQAMWFGANFLLYCGCANIRRGFRRKRANATGGGPATCQFALRSGLSYHSDSGVSCSVSPKRAAATGSGRIIIPGSADCSPSDSGRNCNWPATTVPAAAAATTAGKCGGSGGGTTTGSAVRSTRIQIQFFDDDSKKLIDIADDV